MLIISAVIEPACKDEWGWVSVSEQDGVRGRGWLGISVKARKSGSYQESR